jgi:hypothetical protein
MAFVEHSDTHVNSVTESRPILGKRLSFGRAFRESAQKKGRPDHLGQARPPYLSLL